MKGIHPDLGDVTLSQLLSTWTVHDLDHINQISRVMAKQYNEAVGPMEKLSRCFEKTYLIPYILRCPNRS